MIMGYHWMLPTKDYPLPFGVLAAQA